MRDPRPFSIRGRAVARVNVHNWGGPVFIDFADGTSETVPTLDEFIELAASDGWKFDGMQRVSDGSEAPSA